MGEYKKYCEGLDCIICDEKEPCIYRIANKLQETLQLKEQECEQLKFTIKHTGLLDLMNKNVELKTTLNEIEKLLQAASDPEITTAEESSDNIYECINLAKNSPDINDSFPNDKKAKYEQTLKEIRATAGHLYYQAITDPVKRAEAIYSIIDKVDEVMK